jgi:type IX secretion system PorP/SprF family membrane protein
MKNYIYKTLLVILAATGVLKNAQAQDNQFTQFYAAPLFINPAFTGALNYACDDPRSRWRGVVNYRRQWSYFNTTAASIDYLKPGTSRTNALGFGGQVLRDVGKNGFNSINVAGSASYITSLTKDWGFNAGLQIGYGSRGFSGGNLTYPDQYNDFGFKGNITPDNKQAYSTAGFVDVATGVLLYSSNFWVGLASHHINKPNQAIAEEGVDKLDRRFSIHTGYKFSFNENKRSLTKVIEDHSISPVLQYRRQGSFNQLDLGAYYVNEPFTAGLSYRGLPLKKTPDNTLSNDAVTALVGLKYLGFRFGYSFDFTLSKLRTGTYKNAHEISIAYQFVSDKCKRRLIRRVACPSF